jgi:hypothetical protein
VLTRLKRLKNEIAALNKFNEIVDLARRNNKMKDAKSIFKSKTFWLNAIGLVQILTNIVPVDPEITAVIMTLLNILNRKLTDGPVYIIPPIKPV